MTTFRFAYFALVLAACTQTPAPRSPAGTAPPAPPKLGPDLTRADFDARLADHRLHAVSLERLPDASGDVGPLVPADQRVRVDGDVIAALSCRPGGLGAQTLSDDHYVYLVYEYAPTIKIVSPDGRMMPTPSTYCSFERFRIPAGLAYGGSLSVKR